MQWIKTLFMFLALFLGSDALCAQSQSPVIAKHTTTPIISDTSSFLSWTGAIQSKALVIKKTNQQIVVHNDTIPKKSKKSKYRCGSKRFKNFHHGSSRNMRLNTIGTAHRHTKYCCGRFCCGKKSWKDHQSENIVKHPDPFWVCEFQDNHDGVGFLSPPPNNDFISLPEVILHSRHRALCVIAPRE